MKLSVQVNFNQQKCLEICSNVNNSNPKIPNIKNKFKSSLFNFSNSNLTQYLNFHLIIENKFLGLKIINSLKICY